eukprot:COSAG05_NODE_1694_length_4265_cov_73.510312_9_plen_84_part_00
MDTRTQKMGLCVQPHAWTPRDYGIRIISIAIGRAGGVSEPLSLPVDINLKGTVNQTTQAWHPAPEHLQVSTHARARAIGPMTL